MWVLTREKERTIPRIDVSFAAHYIARLFLALWPRTNPARTKEKILKIPAAEFAHREQVWTFSHRKNSMQYMRSRSIFAHTFSRFPHLKTPPSAVSRFYTSSAPRHPKTLLCRKYAGCAGAFCFMLCHFYGPCLTSFWVGAGKSMHAHAEEGKAAP